MHRSFSSPQPGTAIATQRRYNEHRCHILVDSQVARRAGDAGSNRVYSWVCIGDRVTQDRVAEGEARSKLPRA
jgi:hypothetical protein